MEKNKKIIFKIFSLFLFAPFFANAGVLSMYPSQKAPRVGDVVTVSIVAGTSNESMNAASGEISFDKNILEATKISKTGSIISLWAEEPTINNVTGRISFEGIALSPGYIGDNGKIFSISFKVKKAGEAKLSFVNGSLLANDGTGGNILSTMNPLAIVVLGNRESSVVVDKTPSVKQESTPKTTPPNIVPLFNNDLEIKSSSHLEEDKWYSDNTPEFTWSLPSGTLEIKTLINKSEDRTPNISYIPPVSEKIIDTLSDGKYYFSVIARTENGWGKISKRIVKIDTVPPTAFTVKIANETRDRKLPPALIFKTSDSLTDIAKYEVQIGSGAPVVTEAHGSDNPFLVPPQNPGAYVATVTAYDEAGNKRTESVGFVIDAIDTPRVLAAPSIVTAGDNVEIRGISYPKATLTFYYKDGENIVLEESVKADVNGAFAIPITRKIGSGAYILTVRATDENGARSNETAPKIISFKPIYTSFSFILYSLLFIIVVVSVFIAIFMWKRSQKIVENASHNTKGLVRDVEHITERSFEILKDDIVNRLAEMRAIRPKRKAIDDEIIFLEEMESNITEAKDIIITDIQKIFDDEIK